jgi:hypothetical protein
MLCDRQAQASRDLFVANIQCLVSFPTVRKVLLVAAGLLPKRSASEHSDARYKSSAHSGNPSNLHHEKGQHRILAQHQWTSSTTTRILLRCIPKSFIYLATEVL